MGELDFFDPLGAHAEGVEEEEGVVSESLEVGFVWVKDAEADITFGASWDTVLVGSVWSFEEGSLSEEGVGFVEFCFNISGGDLDEFTWAHASVDIDHSFFINNPLLGWYVSDHNP